MVKWIPEITLNLVSKYFSDLSTYRYLICAAIPQRKIIVVNPLWLFLAFSPCVNNVKAGPVRKRRWQQFSCWRSTCFLEEISAIYCFGPSNYRNIKLILYIFVLHCIMYALTIHVVNKFVKQEHILNNANLSRIIHLDWTHWHIHVIPEFV